MSHEEKDESMLTNVSQSPSGQQINRRDTASCQLNTSKRRQLMDTQSNLTNSFPGPSRNRVNVIHNKLNTAEDRQRVTSRSNIDISLSSPEECPDNRMYNIQPSNSVRSYGRYNNDDVNIDMDTVDDDDDDDVEEEMHDNKLINKSQDSDDNIEVDDGLFRVAGFIDDDGSDLETNVNILRMRCETSQLVRPFVDLYTTPTVLQNKKDNIMLMLESYNSWFKGFKARNMTEPQLPIVEHSSPFPKQTFADKMKGDTATPPKTKEKELHVQLIDINSSPTKESKSICDEFLNNSKASISSPLSEKEEKIFNKPQDFPDLYSKTTAAAKELRSPPINSYSNKLHTTTKEPRSNQSAGASSSNIVEITTDERWNPNSGSWTNNRKTKQKPNNDLNKSNDQQNADVKVQCPICQRSFSLTKVEGHAAQCFQFPRETRSNNQDTTSTEVTSSGNLPSTKNKKVDVDLTDSDNEWEEVRSKANKRTDSDNEWEEVRSKANKRKGCSDEEDPKGTDYTHVKRACRTKQ